LVWSDKAGFFFEGNHGNARIARNIRERERERERYLVGSYGGKRA
jgi:hypothetical protein